MPILKKLNLSESTIQSLPEGFFDNLTGLEELNFSYTKNLVSLPTPNNPMHNLKKIILSESAIQSLPVGFFDNLIGLEELNLSDSYNIQSLPKPNNPIPDLVIIDLSESSIQSLPEGFFDNLTGLEELYFEHTTNIQTLPTPNNPMPDLTKINLSGSSIQSLPEGFFDNLIGLEELDLTDTDNLQSLPTLNTPMSNLKRINLWRSYIQSLPEGFFDNLIGLEELDLRDTKNLQSLPKPNNPMANLKKINLWRSYIQSLPEGFFDNLIGLEELDLVWTENLQSLPKPNSPMPNLKKIYLSGSPIQSLPAGFFDNLTGLEELGLSSTKNIQSLPKFFNPMPNLKRISLSVSPILSLPEGFFDNLIGLEELYLQETKNLQSLPALNKSMPNLKTIILAGLPIQSLPEDFFDNLTGLEILYLSHTYDLQSFPKFKHPMPHLKKINLHGSPIHSLPEDFFDNLTDLEELYLSYTKTLQSLPKPNNPMPNLNKIYLSVSPIHSLPEGFFDNLNGLEELDLSATKNLQSLPKPNNPIPNLKKISLANSSIQSLPEGFFDNLTGLVELDFEHTLHLQSLPKPHNSMSNLKKINLRGSSIQSLPEGFFDNLTGLVELDLLYIKTLQSLPTLNTPMSNLKRINLSGSPIQSLPQGFFDNLTGLEELDLSLTEQLQSLPIPNKPMPNLKKLNLSNSFIQSLPQGFFDNLIGSEELDFSGTRNLQSLPKPNKPMPNLKKLNLSNSFIQSLPEGFFDNLIGLEEMYLSEPKILHPLPTLNEPMPNLKKIDLAWSSIKSLPEGFFDNLTGLVELGLSSTKKLKSLAKFKNPMPTLKIINLRWSSIQSLPEDFFDNLVGLEELDLRGTRNLQSLPKPNNPMPNLKKIILSESAIQSLPVGFFDNLTGLEELELRETPIKSIPDSLIIHPSLKRLYYRNTKLPQFYLNLHTSSNADLPALRQIVTTLNSNPETKLTPVYSPSFAIVGNSGAGKTTLLSRIQDPAVVPKDHSTTISISFKRKNFPNHQLNPEITFFDFAGQKDFRKLQKQFVNSSVGIIFVFKINTLTKAGDIPSFIDNHFKPWFSMFPPPPTHQICPVFLVGTFYDEVELQTNAGLPKMMKNLSIELDKFLRPKNFILFPHECECGHFIMDLKDDSSDFPIIFKQFTDSLIDTCFQSALSDNKSYFPNQPTLSHPIIDDILADIQSCTSLNKSQITGKITETLQKKHPSLTGYIPSLVPSFLTILVRTHRVFTVPITNNNQTTEIYIPQVETLVKLCSSITIFRFYLIQKHTEELNNKFEESQKTTETSIISRTTSLVSTVRNFFAQMITDTCPNFDTLSTKLSKLTLPQNGKFNEHNLKTLFEIVAEHLFQLTIDSVEFANFLKVSLNILKQAKIIFPFKTSFIIPSLARKPTYLKNFQSLFSKGNYSPGIQQITYFITGVEYDFEDVIFNFLSIFEKDRDFIVYKHLDIWFNGCIITSPDLSFSFLIFPNQIFKRIEVVHRYDTNLIPNDLTHSPILRYHKTNFPLTFEYTTKKILYGENSSQFLQYPQNPIFHNFSPGVKVPMTQEFSFPNSSNMFLLTAHTISEPQHMDPIHHRFGYKDVPQDFDQFPFHHIASPERSFTSSPRLVILIHCDGIYGIPHWKNDLVHIQTLSNWHNLYFFAIDWINQDEDATRRIGISNKNRPLFQSFVQSLYHWSKFTQFYILTHSHAAYFAIRSISDFLSAGDETSDRARLQKQIKGLIALDLPKKQEIQKAADGTLRTKYSDSPFQEVSSFGSVNNNIPIVCLYNRRYPQFDVFLYNEYKSNNPENIQFYNYTLHTDPDHYFSPEAVNTISKKMFDPPKPKPTEFQQILANSNQLLYGQTTIISNQQDMKTILSTNFKNISSVQTAVLLNQYKISKKIDEYRTILLNKLNSNREQFFAQLSAIRNDIKTNFTHTDSQIEALLKTQSKQNIKQKIIIQQLGSLFQENQLTNEAIDTLSTKTDEHNAAVLQKFSNLESHYKLIIGQLGSLFQETKLNGEEIDRLSKSVSTYFTENSAQTENIEQLLQKLSTEDLPQIVQGIETGFDESVSKLINHISGCFDQQTTTLQKGIDQSIEPLTKALDALNQITTNYLEQHERASERAFASPNIFVAFYDIPNTSKPRYFASSKVPGRVRIDPTTTTNHHIQSKKSYPRTPTIPIRHKICGSNVYFDFIFESQNDSICYNTITITEIQELFEDQNPEKVPNMSPCDIHTQTNQTPSAPTTNPGDPTGIDCLWTIPSNLKHNSHYKITLKIDYSFNPKHKPNVASTSTVQSITDSTEITLIIKLKDSISISLESKIKNWLDQYKTASARLKQLQTAWHKLENSPFAHFTNSGLKHAGSILRVASNPTLCTDSSIPMTDRILGILLLSGLVVAL